MSLFLSAILLQLIGISSPAKVLSNDCPSSTCGGLEIRLPFTVESSPESCSQRGVLRLSCSSSNEALLTLPSSEKYRVTSIDYKSAHLTVQVSSSSVSCPLINLRLPNTNGSVYDIHFLSFVLLDCTRTLSLATQNSFVAGPISCPCETGGFVYAMESDEPMYNLPPYCSAISSGKVPVPDDSYTLQDFIRNSEEKLEAFLHWGFQSQDDMLMTCVECEDKGKECGYNQETYQTFCISKHSHKGQLAYILGGVIGAVVLVFLFAAFVLLYFYQKYRKEKEKRLKVELFLATYKSTKLSRYSFADIKKMTDRFKHKLGQGGFGSVYKGELSNGIPVAVKILETSRSNGEEFVNEVSTIGKIHHVNVVRLLGFCSDGTNRALVYEFMPNESLEKYIFMDESKKKHPLFSKEKMQEIAVGIAQGIEYLHQGCNQRILHFDIKPHNILLDYDFNPKISDFGLAKLCSRDQSIVTISAARGTMGYIAPEVYSRNFGSVSHKSDVYSFGMLLLEMIGRRKNVDPTMEKLSEIYFPEWIYNKLLQGSSLGLDIDMECSVEIMRKLAVTALWCIQWNPAERPSMTKVVQMLLGDCNTIEIPPRPFVPSSESQYDMSNTQQD